MKQSLLGRRQYAFCPAKACNTDLLGFCEVVSKCVDKGDPVDVMYLDFQKNQAQYESAACPGSQEGKPHPGVH